MDEAKCAVKAGRDFEGTWRRVREFLKFSFNSNCVISEEYKKDFNKVDRFNRFLPVVRLRFRPMLRLTHFFGLYLSISVINAWIKQRSLLEANSEEEEHRSLKTDLKGFVVELVKGLAPGFDKTPVGRNRTRL